MADDIEIVEFLPEHASDVAKLHISGITTGFISSLGANFVTALYQTISKSKYAFGFVAIENGEIVGFSCFTTNLNKFYKSVILKGGLKLMFIVAWKMFSFERIKKILETLFYPNRIKKMNLPSAEFLSMVVCEQARGKRLATRLMCSGFEECARQGIEKIKIFALVEIIGINKMYEKYGFELVGQMANHGALSNVYVADVGKDYTAM
jgi:ribosomal protein S18 acetylase RimI-like enzyme